MLQVFILTLFWVFCNAQSTSNAPTIEINPTSTRKSVSISGTSSALPSQSFRPLGTRAHHGLQPDGMQKNSIYIGVLPDWSKESPLDVNRALGATVAIVGDYIYVGSPTQNNPFSQMNYHSPDIVRLRGSSVYAPAILPNFSLDQWTDSLSEQLADAAASLNSRGVTVWLRPMYEMNGDWMKYGLNPSQFISTYRNLVDAVRNHSGCNSTYFLWSPNIYYGDVDDLQGYTQYYPGENYVDIAGLSWYYSNSNQNSVPGSSNFIQGFRSFYSLYGSRHPMAISETSAAYYYQVPDYLSEVGPDSDAFNVPNTSTLTPIPSNWQPSEVTMKSNWISQLTGPQAAGRYPNLTSVSFFNYFKRGWQPQLLDFRVTGGNPDVESWFRTYAGNVTAYQGGFDGGATHAKFSVLFVTAALLCISFVLTW